jgi:hypothetical protein
VSERQRGKERWHAPIEGCARPTLAPAMCTTYIAFEVDEQVLWFQIAVCDINAVHVHKGQQHLC